MEEIAPRVHRLTLAPRDGLNAYLVGDVLVDAGMTTSAKRIVAALDGRDVRAIALTHAHADHVGGAKAVCEQLGLELWAPAGDVDAVEAGRPVTGATRLAPLLRRTARWPARKVDRALNEGDDVAAGFAVLDAPGHSPGHIALWRASDRTLICGDVWFNLQLPTLKPGLRLPFAAVTVDPARNRESGRRLAKLGADIALFGHGPPLKQAGPKLSAFMDWHPA
jgi:glyoxylase-like metal-dependent hydrolase (beta-lactamase superfamily II)